MAIELDGGQHDGSKKDKIRTAYLEAQGWKVMRFWNNEILENIEGVYQTIVQVLEELSSHPHSALLRSADLSRGAGEV